MTYKIAKFRASISSAEDFQSCFVYGVEREALRVTDDGKMSTKDHPKLLGDSFCHPSITTDFAENQLEFVTSTSSSMEKVVEELNDLQAWAQQRLGDEMLWPLSMPPDMHDPEQEIQIARYGNSSDARKAEVYRKGLALRYGKGIQVVSGVHFNFSFTEEFWERVLARDLSDEEKKKKKNEMYMSLVRNFLRYRFILVYLFGASPVAGRGYPFLSDVEQKSPISIRMSRYGYSNTQERGMLVSYNSLEEYVRDLRRACSTSYAPYEKLGIGTQEDPLQLNTNILQLPSEYYSPVRIKPLGGSGKDLLDALDEEGIGHIEFRAFDVSPFHVAGVDLDQLRVFHVILLHLFFMDNVPLSPAEREAVNEMQRTVALCGRGDVVQKQWKREQRMLFKVCDTLVPAMRETALWIDDLLEGSAYSDAFAVNCERIQNGDIVSVEMMREMEKDNLSHQEYGVMLATKYRKELLARSVSPNVSEKLEELV